MAQEQLTEQSWEEVARDYLAVTHKLRVPGGWLYRTMATRDFSGQHGIGLQVTFVSDPLPTGRPKFEG